MELNFLQNNREHQINIFIKSYIKGCLDFIISPVLFKMPYHPLKCPTTLKVISIFK